MLQQYFKKQLQNFIGTESSNRSLLIGSSQAFLIKGISALVAFISQIVIARVLGVTNYGFYIYALTWINFLTLVGKLGIDDSSKKFLSAYNQKKQWSHLRGFLQFAFLSVLIAGVVLTILVWAGTYTTYKIKNYEVELFITFLIAACILPVNSLTQIGEASLQAFKKVKEGLIPHYVLRPTLILAAIALLGLYFDMKVSASMAMGINFLTTILVFGLTYSLLLSNLPVRFFSKSKKFATRKWARISFPLIFTTGFHVFLGQADILFLGILQNTDLAGIYGAVSKVSAVVFFGVYSVNIILAPTISEMYSNHQIDKLQSFLKRAITLTLLFITPTTIILALGSYWILYLFGSEFTAGQLSLIILLIGQFFAISIGSVTHLMTMTEYQKESVWILGIAIVINIGLNVILIPYYGMEGAAIATIASMLTWKIIMHVFIKRKLKVDASIFSLLK